MVSTNLKKKGKLSKKMKVFYTKNKNQYFDGHLKEMSVCLSTICHFPIKKKIQKSPICFAITRKPPHFNVL